jgi:hypothetical protein
MSASQALALTAVAYQFSAALQSYAEDMDRLVQEGAQAERYQRISGRMDEMRLYAVSLPTLSAAWVEVLIRHFELTHKLLRAQQQRTAADLADVQFGWRDAVQRLSRKCLQLIPAA